MRGRPPNSERPRTVEALAPDSSGFTRRPLRAFGTLSAEDLDRELPFFGRQVSIRDIFWDMIISHGVHHRGQLALMCRLAGGQAPDCTARTARRPRRCEPARRHSGGRRATLNRSLESRCRPENRRMNLPNTMEEIAAMLEHHRALETLARRQDAAGRGVADQLQRRQNEAVLQRRVRDLHPADPAFVLESLPPVRGLTSGRRSTPLRRPKCWSNSTEPRVPGRSTRPTSVG